jgi:hypothetical protein
VEGNGFVVIDIFFEALFECFVFLSEFGEFVRRFTVAVLIVFGTDSDMGLFFCKIFILIILFFIYSFLNLFWFLMIFGRGDDVLVFIL